MPKDQETTPEYFDRLYRNGGWFGKGSGPGSTLRFTKDYCVILQTILRVFQPKTVIDLGCGDWQFSQFIDWGNAEYLGIDCSSKLIEQNKKKFPNVHWQEMNLENLSLVTHDLVILKDVLHHMKKESVGPLLEACMGAKQVLVTADVNPDGTVANAEECDWFWKHCRFLYEFDITVEEYPFGPKKTWLYTLQS